MKALGRDVARGTRTPATTGPVRCLWSIAVVCCQCPECVYNDKIELLHVQGNVYMLAGAGPNITVQIGDKSVMLVDAGIPQMSDKVVAAIRALTDKPIVFIVDTSMDDDHTGGNASLASAGSALANAFGQDTSTITASKLSSGAAIFAHINVLNRMSAPTGQKASAPEEAWPTDTYESDDWRFYNGESCICSMSRMPTLTATASFFFVVRML